MRNFIDHTLRGLLELVRANGPEAPAAARLYIDLTASDMGQVMELEHIYELPEPPEQR